MFLLAVKDRPERHPHTLAWAEVVQQMRSPSRPAIQRGGGDWRRQRSGRHGRAAIVSRATTVLLSPTKTRISTVIGGSEGKGWCMNCFGSRGSRA